MFANPLMKTDRNTQQEQKNFTRKSTFANLRKNLNPVQQLSQCFWSGGNHQQPRQQQCPAFGKRCGKCGMVIWRASVEVEQDDKDDSSNQILSMKTMVKKLRIRVVINNLRLEIFLPCKARCF